MPPKKKRFPPARPAMKKRDAMQLRAALLEAIAHRDVPQKFSSTLGPEVEVRLDRGGANHLTLRRADTYPTLDEWAAVVNFWPQPLPTALPKPNRYKSGESYCLAATWRPPRPDPFGQTQPQEATANV